MLSFLKVKFAPQYNPKPDINNLAIHHTRTEKFGKASVNHLCILHLKERNKILTFTKKIIYETFWSISLMKPLLKRTWDNGNLKMSDIKQCQVYFLRTEKKHQRESQCCYFSVAAAILTSQNTFQNAELLDNIEVRKNIFNHSLCL